MQVKGLRELAVIATVLSGLDYRLRYRRFVIYRQARSVVIVHPVKRALDRLLPLPVPALACNLVHVRNPLSGLVPVRSQALDVGPESHRKTGGVCRAERNGLRNVRPHDRHTEHVGEELHQQARESFLAWRHGGGLEPPPSRADDGPLRHDSRN